MSVDEMRAGLHGMWGSVAGGWGENAEFVDARGSRIASAMLETTAPQAGERVLELACGPGGMGLVASPLVEPGGEVVMSDIAEGMIAIAAERAASLGLDNVSTRVLDLERIDEPDASFDVVLCREGLMLVPEPDAAAAEVTRVLRPGGRAAFAVWGPRASNPWLGVLMDAVSEHIGSPVPPAGIPGPFSLGDRDQVAKILTDAGLSAVSVSELASPFKASSFDEWWSIVPSLAGPLAQLLAALPAEANQAIQASARKKLAEYETSDGLEIPGLSLVATGRRT